eukprot:5740772-Pleurochrysis_carterae.AAC.2
MRRHSAPSENRHGWLEIAPGHRRIARGPSSALAACARARPRRVRCGANDEIENLASEILKVQSLSFTRGKPAVWPYRLEGLLQSAKCDVDRNARDLWSIA